MPLSLYKIVKQSLQWIQSCEDVPFWLLNDPFARQKFFLEKTIFFSSTYWPLSLCKIKKKKILEPIQSYEDMPFLHPKWSICPNKNFFGNSAHESFSFHSCLSKFQTPESETNLLIKYWWLKNTEISLSESCFRAYCENCMPGKNLVLKLYNLRTRFFPGMQFSQNVREP